MSLGFSFSKIAASSSIGFCRIAVLFLSFFFVTPAHSLQLTLGWDGNTEPDVTGYNVYYGTSSRTYASHVDAGKQTSFTLSNLQDGSKYFFAVTAYNAAGKESAYSPEVVYNPPAPSCSYSISPSSQTLPAPGGPGAVNVTSNSGCPWTAVSNASWIIITSNSSGSASGTVNYSVSQNTASAARTGNLMIAGKTFTLTQAGAACAYSISPSSRSLEAAGGTGTINVTGPTGCSWSASSGASWVTITSGANGNGNGSCGYSVAANAGASSRTGSLTIAGQTFSINQAGASCSFSISPASQSFVSAGGTGSLSVAAPSGCSWSASSGATWININSGTSGSGNGTCAYSVADNPGTSSRTGSITVAGKTFSVTQSGGSAGNVVFTLNSGGSDYKDSGGTVYRSDRYYTGGSTWKSATGILETGDDPLYQSERYGNFSYAIPLANGNYTVVLKFAEIYWSASGKRVFDVYIEGQKVIASVDIFAQVGKNRAYEASIPVTVRDGKLNIKFRTIKDNAKVSAILVRTR